MNNNKIINNFFYSVNKSEPNKKQTNWTLKIFWFVFLITIVIISFVFVGFSFSPNGFSVFKENFKKIFLFSSHLSEFPSYSLWTLSFQSLYISIKSILIGTSLGFITALITATFANTNLFKHKYLSHLITLFIVILRSLPTIFLIYFFSSSFPKELALLLMIFWFSWIWLHKYLIDAYNNIDYYFYNSMLNQGVNKFVCIVKIIFPQLKNKFINYYLFSFESNIRWTTFISSLGFSGIGELIFLAANKNEFQAIGIPIFVCMLFMVVLEISILLINKLLLSKSYSKNSKIINIKKYFSYFLLFILIFFNLYFLFSTNFSGNNTINIELLKSLFTPEFSVFKKYDNLVFDVFLLIFQAITSITIVIFISFFLMFLSSFKLFKYYSIFGIIISSILRNFPTIALFFVINPIFNSPSSTITIILATSSSGIIVKNISESINKIDDYLINHYSMQGFNKFNIYTKLILPTIKNDLFLQISFSFENKFRDIISYSGYGVSVIGSYIDKYQQRNDYNAMNAFILLTFFISLIVVIINFIQSQVLKKGFINYIYSFNWNNIKSLVFVN